MNKARETPIRIVRKKGHHAHHGGAWKVAMADFMTAMFALFLVLWLVNQSSDVKAAVAGYFQDPLGRTDQHATAAIRAPTGSADTPRPLAEPDDAHDLRRDRLRLLADRLRRRIEGVPDLAGLRAFVEIEMVEDGLRIQLLEDSAGMFFQTGSSAPSRFGRELLTILGAELALLPNHVALEGHTDARPYPGPGYTNWELSADRANAARRIMTQGGLRQSQVVQVRGFAERVLRVPDDPNAARNRRVAITVLFDSLPLPPPPGPPAMSAAGDAR